MKAKLYIKKDNGRYEEYHEPKQEYDNKLYRKVGKKYEPCSMLIDRDLREGVWVVVKHKSCLSLINGQYMLDKYLCLKAADIQEVSLSELGGWERITHYLVHNIDRIHKPCSDYEFIQGIVGLLREYQQKNKEK